MAPYIEALPAKGLSMALSSWLPLEVMACRVDQASNVAAEWVAMLSPSQRCSLCRPSDSNWATDTVIVFPGFKNAAGAEGRAVGASGKIVFAVKYLSVVVSVSGCADESVDW